jgi:D-3-phosphoglycerate dehydrogenase/C-terminal binding protein
MAQQRKVVITDFLRDGLEPERKILGDVARPEWLGASDEEQLIGRIEDADAIMMYHDLTISRRTIERLEHCKLIVRCGVGIDNVDHAFARQRGIPVGNIPDYGSEEVADTAIGMMLALTRGISLLNSRLRAGLGPWYYTQAVPLRRLRGQVFGIVGLGRIGSAVAARAKALGMNVVFVDPFRDDGWDKALGIRRVETLPELLRQSMVVSVHCPLTEQTRSMIDARAIEQMPMGSYLINTARGAIVDTTAIPDAIVSGRLAGAGIDVLPKEPPGDDDPFYAAWRNPEHPAHHRVLINPHSAFYSEEGLLEMRTKGAESCRRALLGLPMRNIVN